MFNKKVKIEINDNFIMIMNYINSAQDVICYKELLQFCIDYQVYMELYLNFKVFEKLIEERNLDIIHNKKIEFKSI